MTTTARHVVGVMTGSSIDALDAALVLVEEEGLAMRGRLLTSLSLPLGPLAPTLRDAAAQKPMTAGEFAELAWIFGGAHADAIEILCSQGGIKQPDLIVVHGQTVVHRPPISWQLINVFPITARFGCRVVHDLRQADLAANGQGAPITPLADWVLFRDDAHRRAIVNLGGFCNVTLLAAGSKDSTIDDVRGFDICSCNQVLDAVARELLDAPFDAGGDAALHGKADPDATDALRSILAGQRRTVRSLGTGDEGGGWISTHRERVAPRDMAASAVAAVATTIAAEISRHGTDEVLLAGGGTRNMALIGAIEDALGRAGAPAGVRTTESCGIPPTIREAVAMAVLGSLTEDRVPITLSQVTRRGSVARDGSRTDGR